MEKEGIYWSCRHINIGVREAKKEELRLSQASGMAAGCQ